MAKKYFEYIDAKSSKFWEITTSSKKLTICYGKIGTDGLTTLKEFATPAEAKERAEKLILEKTKKGYAEVSIGKITSKDNKQPDSKKNKEIKVYIDHNKTAYADCIKWISRKNINKCTPFLDIIRCELNSSEYSFLEFSKNDFFDPNIYNFDAILGDEKNEYYLCYTLDFKVNLDNYHNFKKALKYSKNYVEIVLGFKDEKGIILNHCYEPVKDCPSKFEI
jgi:predicted DNA-binding WGR domain protein